MASDPIVLPGRKHRTVLFVDGDSFDKGDPYAERTKRLAQSLNGVNIKVDIVTVRNGDFRVADLTVAASTAGYDQVLFSVAPSTDKLAEVPKPKPTIIAGLG